MSFVGHQYNLYLAAVYTNQYMPGQKQYDVFNDREKYVTANCMPHILESWHYVGAQRYVDDMRNNSAKIFLDSGAFSAYTLGVKLRVEDYVGYILRNQDILRKDGNVTMASVLDGIGDPLETWRNQTAMESLGFRPLPCFHAGEDERYLEHYVQNYEYITLGGMVGVSTKQLCTWLDRVWGRYLVDGSGRARIKVHGFGITARSIMERYPWHSVDSSSWIQSASFGAIETPEHGPMSVSDKSPSRHDAGQHVTTLTPLEQDYVYRKLEENGWTYERLSTVYQSRAAYNLWAYGVINQNINALKAKRDGTFGAEVMELF